MAIKMISMKCPDCGAQLDFEEGRKQAFCSYCGAKVIIQNDDEAKVEQALTDRMIKLKELEMREKADEIKRAEEKQLRTRVVIGGTIIAIVCFVFAAVMFNSLMNMDF